MKQKVSADRIKEKLLPRPQLIQSGSLTPIKQNSLINVSPVLPKHLGPKILLHRSPIRPMFNILSKPSNPSQMNSQIHSSRFIVPKASSVSPTRDEASATSPTVLQRPSLIENGNKKLLNKSFTDQTKSGFKPYTLHDYNVIKPRTYYQLGGLGASNIGTNDWLIKKLRYDKRKSYGKNVYYSNAIRLPLLPANHSGITKEEVESSRMKGIKFAKTIHKPPLKIPVNSYEL